MDFFRGVINQAAEMGQAAAQNVASGRGHHAPIFGFGGHHPPAQQQQPRQQRRPEPPLESTIKAPPASLRTLKTLPTIVVTPEDLVDPNNRECCICFEPHRLKSRALRLPCSHIYHPPCILDWLARSCTCPVCRYELPTEDASYEVGRKKRMAARKPRYARYELERMTAQQLRSLAVNRLRLDPSELSGLERSQLIATLIESDKLEVISAPEPVEHCLSALHSMGPRKLRMTMEEAGVFYSKEDVVEKADMISLFLRSGRVALIPEEEENEAGDMGINCMEVDHHPKEPNTSNAAPIVDQSELKQKKKGDDEDDAAQWSDASSSQDGDSVTPDLDDTQSNSVIDMFGERTAPNGHSEPDASASSTHISTSFAAADATPFPAMVGNDPLSSLEEDDVVNETAGNAAPDTSTAATASPNMYECPNLGVDFDGADRGMLPNVTRHTRMVYYSSRSIAQLRLLAGERGVDVSDCIEKREMISRLADAESYVQT